MILREYRSSDCEQLFELFYNTVHTINSKDYTEEQLNAWTNGVDLEKWDKSLKEHNSLVAVDDKKIVGFCDMDKTGYLDRLYIHKDFQGQGIATAICNALEKNIQTSIITHASITAKPFFEKRGYKVIKIQHVEKQGILLTNYVMEKDIRL